MGMPDSRWDTRWNARLCMGYQIMNGVTDRGGVLDRIAIWPPLLSYSTGWHKKLISH